MALTEEKVLEMGYERTREVYSWTMTIPYSTPQRETLAGTLSLNQMKERLIKKIREAEACGAKIFESFQ